MRGSRFLMGYVRLEAEGGLPERFVTLAAEEGIPLWSTARRGMVLTACCPAAVYRRLRPIARRSGMRMRVKRRRGLPFLLRPLRLRWGLAAGTLAAAVLLAGLSSRVWVVTVEGNETLTDAQILQVVEPLGVRTGADFSAVDIPLLQLTALQQLPGLSWLAVNQKGCTVTVQVREKEVSQPVEDTAPANVVAACDGVIVSLNVTGGQAMVKAGDAVTAGTLLISGVTDSKVGPLLRRASGQVMARTTLTLTERVPLTDTVTQAGTAITRPALMLFGLRIPLYTDSRWAEGTDSLVAEYPLYARGKPLPVGWQVEYRIPRQAVTVTRTADQAAALALERLTAREAEALAGATVEDRQVREERSADAVTVTVAYTCIRDIGESRVITTR